MRPAPPLALRCSASRTWRAGCAVIGSVAGLAAAGWVAGHLEWALPAFVLACLVGTPCGAALGWRAAGAGDDVHLSWDGRCWWVDGTPGELQVRLDLDRWLLLLRHRPAGGRAAKWLAVSFARGADDMRALRTALYSPPPEDTPEQPHVRAPDRATD
jgi:hypothetical protein